MITNLSQIKEVGNNRMELLKMFSQMLKVL